MGNPDNAEKLCDEQIKSGKYVVNREKIFDKNVKSGKKCSYINYRQPFSM